MSDFLQGKAKERETARAVLQLLQEESVAEDPLRADAYGLLTWQESSDQREALLSDGEQLLFCPALLTQDFLRDSEELRTRFRGLCLDAFFAKYGASGARHLPGAGGQRGKGAGADAESAALVRRDGMDYRKFLQRFCIPREEAILDTESFDYIPYLYGLSHYGNMPFLEPLEYREVNRLDELAIAIDTSGSCSGTLVRRFLEETWNILRQRENFFRHMRLHVIQCDSMIQEYRIFTSVEEWEAALPDYQILGHGNTDFCPVFRLLTDQIQKREIRSLRALLYFTDGDGIYPVSAPPFETAFVFLNQDSEKGKIPEWAIRLNLDLKDLRKR